MAKMGGTKPATYPFSRQGFALEVSKSPFFLNNASIVSSTQMDWLIKILWRQSHAIGLAPSLLCATTWLVCGGVVARFGVGALWQYPRLAFTFLIVVGVIVVFGGLISYWILLSHFEFRRRGYQIRWLTKDEWVYEERRADGSVECLPFSRKTAGEGYPTPCSIYVQTEKNWGRQVPQWAQGRRTEILERIADLSGANSGGRVQFSDAI
jgi:hypothetical protein